MILWYNITPRKEDAMEWWQTVLWGLILIVALAIAIAAMAMAPPLSYVILGVAILIFLVDGWWGVWVVLTNPSPPSSTPIPTSSAGWDVQESATTPTPIEYPACYWVFTQNNPMAVSDRCGNDRTHPEWGDVPTPCKAGDVGPDGPTFPPYCWCGGP